MRRVLSYKLTLAEAALLILDQIVTGTASVFYPHPYYHQFCAHAHPRSLYPTLRRLERKHLVGAKQRDGREEWYLTDEGERLAERLKLKLTYVQKQQHWDGKWRLAIFDVPERIRARRDALRRELINLGFHQLQKSVWVTLYLLPDEFFELINEFGLGTHFRVVLATEIRNDRDLRSLFFPRAG